MYIQFGNCGVVHFFLSLHFMYMILSTAQPYHYYPTVNLSTSWTNGPSIPTASFNYATGMMRVILPIGIWDPMESYGPCFACGFFCNGNCDSYLFAIFIAECGEAYGIGFSEPEVIWTANRNWPVKLNSTLHFTSYGDLILKDVDGTVAWSTNTRGKSVVGLKLTDHGNLLLFDENNATVWQSFDYPTDCLAPGQKLIAGQELVPSVSATNWSQLSLFSLTVTYQGVSALIVSDSRQVYSYTLFKQRNREPTYFPLWNGSFVVKSSDPAAPDISILIPLASSSVQYARFCPDGHLRLYKWTQQRYEVADLLEVNECGYPTVCGDYGICSSGQCSCPSTPDNNGMYFKQKNYKQPQLGCSEVTPLSCEASQYQSFIELSNITYFMFVGDHENVDLQSCKDACLKNCLCKAAIFKSNPDFSNGMCYLPNQVFSLINIYKAQDPLYNGDTNSTIVYLKVQNVPALQKKINLLEVILGSSIGFFVLLILIGVLALLSRKKADNDEEDEEDNIELPGMLARFSLEELKVMTENFSKVLGQGGFGSVFEGTRTDGTKIAVKRLNGLVQVKKSFLAEVESIGSIHHVNLVRLLGFSADKSHRILVYEFMPNGSLEKWIFCESNQFFLNWKQKKKIILDIAKGLTYLHEECNQKIIHMDIKPQNILLDHNYNAKICDFGLSKLIDRDKSKVVTTMRGTPGYLAPEWLSSEITEKVDVYSFGVVLLEILCGRKNIDSSQPEELMHLLKVFEKKEAENRLFDLVENCSENMESGKEEMLNLMKIAAWCLRKDYAERPSMSMVVKVLEGDCEVDDNHSYNLSNQPLNKTSSDSTPLLPFDLSGPR